MRIFLTGCAGFIGAKTAELLLEQGYEVIGVDNLNDAYDPTLKRWRLSQLEGKPNFRFQQVDISEWEPTQRVFEAHMPYDAVVNLAARAGVRQSVQNPWVYVATNTTGALNLLELCRQHGIRKYVLASTSSLYANSERPFREDMPTDRPLSPYAASKKGAETMCYTYHHLYGLDITVLRYFTVYGPAGRPDMSIFRFIRWIAEGEPIQVFGDGLQERDFTYVDDIARGTIAALRPLGYEIINLGGDRPVSLKWIIETIEQLVGKQRGVADAADAPRRCAGDLGGHHQSAHAAGLGAASEHRGRAAPQRGVVFRQPRLGEGGGLAVSQTPKQVCVVGLGYVGLPLAVGFAKHLPTIGFDANATRVKELQEGYDRNGEIPEADLRNPNLTLTTDPTQMRDADVIIITVPTPIDKAKRPDLRYLISASQTVGQHMKRGAIVVYESTVYPWLHRRGLRPRAGAGVGDESRRRLQTRLLPRAHQPWRQQSIRWRPSSRS
jgi:UDP-glucuronate 4-epimerase